MRKVELRSHAHCMASEAMNFDPETVERRQTDAGPHRARRRLSDSILIAFHLACDQRDIEVACDLLRVLEFMTRRRPNLPTGREPRSGDSLVAAHERLWEILHFAAEPAVNLGNAFARG
jgi:hypothetical protein